MTWSFHFKAFELKNRPAVRTDSSLESGKAIPEQLHSLMYGSHVCCSLVNMSKAQEVAGMKIDFVKFGKTSDTSEPFRKQRNPL